MDIPFNDAQQLYLETRFRPLHRELQDTNDIVKDLQRKWAKTTDGLEKTVEKTMFTADTMASSAIVITILVAVILFFFVVKSRYNLNGKWIVTNPSFETIGWAKVYHGVFTGKVVMYIHTKDTVNVRHFKVKDNQLICPAGIPFAFSAERISLGSQILYRE